MRITTSSSSFGGSVEESWKKLQQTLIRKLERCSSGETLRNLLYHQENKEWRDVLGSSYWINENGTMHISSSPNPIREFVISSLDALPLDLRSDPTI